MLPIWPLLWNAGGDRRCGQALLALVAATHAGSAISRFRQLRVLRMRSELELM